MDRAHELGKGMGKATLNPLGGLGGTIPVLYELSSTPALDSLGYAVIEQDTERACGRWQGYAENSVVGSGVYASSNLRQ
jgi:hypothetical protein